MVEGLEETAVQDLISPPTGAPLISALGDIGGFRHTSLTTTPAMMFQSPNHGTTTALDFAQTNGNTVVRVGNTSSGSTDSGASFTRLATVDEADSIGFGKAATGTSYPALYTSARIGGVRGIFRSDNAGATWVRINDDNHQWGWTGAAITGDPRVYGRVYVSTNGRGIIVGDTSVVTTVSPSSSASNPAPPSPSASPSSSPSSSSDPGPSCEVTYAVSSQWGGGFGADVTVTNLGYNGSLPANGGTTSSGFNGTWTGTNTKPTAFTLNGTPCTVK